MNLYASTLQALAPLFALILLGYLLKRLRVLHAAHVPVMNGLVMNVTLPALILHGLICAPSLPLRDLLPAVSTIGAEFLTMLLAYGIGRLMRLSTPTVGMLMLVGVFANTGFLGYPMVLALMKDQMPSAILLDQFGMSVPMYVSAAFICASFGARPADVLNPDAQAPRRRDRLMVFFRSPLFVSVLVGLALRLVPWMGIARHVPGAAVAGNLFLQCLEYLAQGTIPVVLLAVGVSLKPSAMQGDLRPIGVAAVLKLIVAPLLAVLFCLLLGLRGDIARVALLQNAMPTSVMASVLSSQNDMDGNTAVAIVFLTTLLSAVTIPLLLGVVH